MWERIFRILLLMIIAQFAFAEEGVEAKPILDKISFQVSAKEWVSTESSTLGVHVNVTLSNANLVRARTDLMERLNKIAKGDWHLLTFDRSQDSSGLEKLDVEAQAQVNQEALTDIYKNAKAVSFPGAKYEVSSVEFKPSLAETQAVMAKIRERLYQQIKDEIARINKAYPTQNYSISKVVFIEGSNPPPLRAYQTKEMNALFVASTQAPALSVSNELVLTAVVELASNRK